MRLRLRRRLRLQSVLVQLLLVELLRMRLLGIHTYTT
jgi:hypothetical protein